MLALACALLLTSSAYPADAPSGPPTPERAAADLGYDLSQPLALDQCIALALRVHPDIQAAVASLRGSLADLQQARSFLYPSFTAGTDYSVSGTPGRTIQVGGVPITTGGGQTTTRTTRLTGSYRLWETGRDVQLSQAKSMVEAARAGVSEAERQLTYLVCQAYFNVLAADRLAAVQEAAVAAAQTHVDLVQARIDAGDAAPVEIHAARTQLHQAQLDLALARNQAALARATLRSALGGPATEIQLVDAWETPSELPRLDECLETAFARRPDLFQARASLRGANLGLKLARLRQWPQVAVSGSAEYGSYSGLSGTTWSVVGTVEQSLFDGGLIRGGIAGARADVQSAEAGLSRVVQAIRLQLETAWLNLREGAERIAVAEAAQAEAQASLSAAETRYAADVGILLEVTDAQVRATRTSVEVVSAVYSYNSALADLHRAMAATEP